MVTEKPLKSKTIEDMNEAKKFAIQESLYNRNMLFALLFSLASVLAVWLVFQEASEVFLSELPLYAKFLAGAVLLGVLLLNILDLSLPKHRRRMPVEVSIYLSLMLITAAIGSFTLLGSEEAIHFSGIREMSQVIGIFIVIIIASLFIWLIKWNRDHAENYVHKKFSYESHLNGGKADDPQS